jgi:hypothetical protein
VSVLVHGHALGFDELLLQIVEDVIVEMELTFEGAIGDPPTLARSVNTSSSNL